MRDEPTPRASTASGALAQPVAALKGIGPRRAADLARAGLHTIEDLLFRFPIRYEDRSHPTAIAALRPGTTALVVAEIVRVTLRRTRRVGFVIVEAILRDDTGTGRAVWFNQRFLANLLAAGQRVVFFGKVETAGTAGLQLTNPDFEVVDGDGDEGGADAPLHAGRIVPVYEKVGSVTPKMQRRLVFEALSALPPRLPDPMPADLRERLGVPDLRTALVESHFPPPGTPIDLLHRFRTAAQQRLILEEFLLFQLGVALRRRTLDAERKPHRIVVDDRIRDAARAVLPFRLTPGQRSALAEIVADLQRPRPMNRLLQGDVGAGKTIVALIAALVAMENGLQVVVMAPTEILAQQHARTFERWLAPTRFKVGLLTGSTPPAERTATLGALAAGTLLLVVGTHALVEEPVTFRSLGLAIVDEQHRFGVVQRAALRAKGLLPDVLVMTATPIPRTLALTVFGELDVSAIRDRPPGRHPVATTARPETRRDEVYAFIRQQIEVGRQAYVIYPIVEESEKIDVKAAVAMADHLQQDVFPSFRVGLLHGRLKPAAKAQVMEAFAKGELDILVSTTVVEVGLDVPNATVMLVEHAERFGLAQLHQLRGRVGRGGHASYCILLYQPPLSDEARARLQTLAETDDGFVIAEKDLELRGPGDVLGTRQSGVPTFRAGDLFRDRDLLARAREIALEWIDRLPPGAAPEALAARVWADRFGLLEVG